MQPPPQPAQASLHQAPGAAPAAQAATPLTRPAAAACCCCCLPRAFPAAPCCRPRRCRKKVGLTGFKCRCGQLFCGTHRYAEAHDCSFDYKTMQREKLAAANPVVQAAKVERI